MFQRGMGEQHVRAIVDLGEVIKSYPDDTPYPSYLLLGEFEGRPLHVVMGHDESAQTGIVVTVYEPSLEIWCDDFRRRRAK